MQRGDPVLAGLRATVCFAPHSFRTGPITKIGKGSILRVRSSLPQRSVPAQCSCNALHRFLGHRSHSSRRSIRSVHPRTSAPLLRPRFIMRPLPALPGLNPNRANLHLECSLRQARAGCAGVPSGSEWGGRAAGAASNYPRLRGNMRASTRSRNSGDQEGGRSAPGATSIPNGG